jgi:hypothetical protein
VIIIIIYEAHILNNYIFITQAYGKCKRSGLFLYLAKFECFNPKITYDPSHLDLFPIEYMEYSVGDIKGDVYYPIGDGPFPIIFMAHGNHGIYYNPTNRNQESCTQNPGWIENSKS